MIQGCREPIALASYPGSGNTWLRYLIEGASGIFTGSIYDDIEIEMKGKKTNCCIDFLSDFIDSLGRTNS